MPKIIYDYRERTSGVIKELIKKEIKVEEKELKIADYILQTKDINDNILNVGIERKTLNDFLNSMIDKRIINQLIILKKQFDISILVIEGEENIYEIRNFHPNAIRGMLATIAIDFQTPILQTKNHRDTASLLSVIAKRLEKPRKHFSLLKKRKPIKLKEQQEFIMESFPGIGPTLSKALLKKFKTIKKIINTEEQEFKKVEKLGPKKIEKIKKVIEKKYK